MQKTLWIVLAALMFAGTASVMTTSTIDDGVSTSQAAGGEGTYPTPACMPGGTNCK